MRGTNRRVITMMMLVMAILEFCPGMSRLNLAAQAASVTCKSKYFVTTKISKNKLKKGQKAKVTVKVSNTSGETMSTLKMNVVLPSELKKVKGSLSKSKKTLKNKKSYSYSFYVKAKKPVTLYKKVTTSRKISGQTTRITAKNLLKKDKKKKYMTVNFSFVKTVDATLAAVVAPSSYADAMIDLLAKMNSYAKSKNSGFAMISNGGYNLYKANATCQGRMLGTVDGVLIEDAFTNGDKKSMQAALLNAAAQGKRALSIEYKSFKGDSRVVSFKATSSSLKTLPAYTNSSSYNVGSLSNVKSFAAILDPKKFKSREAFIKAVNNTDYDLIFMDLFFGYDKNGVQKPWTASEIASLKKKKNGGKRKICAYISVGEAEDYRYYWQSAWDKKAARPAWIDAENEDWEGNYKVKYWYPQWQSILYGSSNAYLDRIIEAGFDGVYLDVIDAYEYFEKKK